MNKRVIIIGGGPAGMMAAIQVCLAGAKVSLLEKNERLGKKLLITGKGRCNLTNTSDLDKYMSNIPGNSRFLYSSFSRFFNQDLIQFFDKLGVKTKEERGGRVFPVSDRAADIVNCLSDYLKRLKVDIKYNAKVDEILIRDGAVQGVKLANKQSIYGDAIIIATGGASYPGTGSTGDGYQLAKQLGHSIVPILPSLVPLEVGEDWIKNLQGLSLKNVTATLFVDNKIKNKQFGEMLFTHFGLSGPIILTLSREVVIGLHRNSTIKLKLNLKPALEFEQLDQRIQRDFSAHLNKMFKNSLDQLLPQKLIPIIIKLSNIDPNKNVHQISKEERYRLIDCIQQLSFNITCSRPISEAIITMGGVNIKELNPKTLQSKLIDNIFFAGEVIDVDGMTGGYNLQIAFSTGYVAGYSSVQ